MAASSRRTSPSIISEICEITYLGQHKTDRRYRIAGYNVVAWTRETVLPGRAAPSGEDDTGAGGDSAASHDFVEILIVMEGQLDLTIASHNLRLAKGDVCFISPGTPHEEHITGDCRLFYLDTDFRQSANLIRHAQDVNDTYTPLFAFLVRSTATAIPRNYLDFTPTAEGAEDRVCRIAEIILSEISSHENGYRELMTGYTVRLFGILENPAYYYCSGAAFTADEDDDLYTRILSYLHTHRRHLTRDDLAAALHYNGSYLSEVFRRRSGQSLAAYNRDICLKEAADLLLNTDLAASEFIHRLGYTNRTAFYRQFSMKFGMTPDQYRQSSADPGKSLSLQHAESAASAD